MRGVTSGSTGQPLEFYLDRAAADTWTGAYLFFLEWAGTAFWHTEIVIASPRHFYLAGRHVGPAAACARRWLLGREQVWLAGPDTTLATLRSAIARSARYRPYHLWAYASYAARLARELLEEGNTLASAPRAVIASAETLLPPERDAIELSVSGTGPEPLLLSRDPADRPDLSGQSRRLARQRGAGDRARGRRGRSERGPGRTWARDRDRPGQLRHAIHQLRARRHSPPRHAMPLRPRLADARGNRGPRERDPGHSRRPGGIRGRARAVSRDHRRCPSVRARRSGRAGVARDGGAPRGADGALHGEDRRDTPATARDPARSGDARACGGRGRDRAHALREAACDQIPGRAPTRPGRGRERARPREDVRAPGDRACARYPGPRPDAGSRWWP